MDEQTAKFVIGAGVAIGVIVWLIAMQLYRRMADTPVIESLEGSAGSASPAEAISQVLVSANQLAGHSKLGRPSESVFELTQHHCHTRIEAYRQGGQTLMTAEVDDTTLRRTMQRILAFFVVLLMPVTIVGVATALWCFAAPSAALAARWQSVQILQIVHVLWPPFLVYGLWKGQRAAAINTTSNLLVLAATMQKTPVHPGD